MWRILMKLKVSVLVLVAWGCVSCGRTAYTVVINGGVGLEGQCIFFRFADTSYQVIDSIYFTGQEFRFQGESGGIRRVELVIGKKQRIPFFLEPGIIFVTLDREQAEVSGTTLNQIWKRFLEEEAIIDQKLQDLYQVYADYLQQKHGDRDYFDRGIQLTQKIDSLTQQKVDIALKYIHENADHEVSACCLQKIVSYLTTCEIEEAVHALSDRVKTSAVGLSVLPLVEQTKLSAVGALVPDYVLQTPDGKQYAIREGIGKGDYILLEFWASWCGPCKKEIPHLQEVLKKYGDKNFRIIGVSLDTEVEEWKKAIEKYDVSWPQLSTLKGFSGDLPRLFRVRGIPTCILVAPDGRIIHRTARGSWLDRFLISEWGDLF